MTNFLRLLRIFSRRPKKGTAENPQAIYVRGKGDEPRLHNRSLFKQSRSLPETDNTALNAGTTGRSLRKKIVVHGLCMGIFILHARLNAAIFSNSLQRSCQERRSDRSPLASEARSVSIIKTQRRKWIVVCVDEKTMSSKTALGEEDPWWHPLQL